MLKRYKDMVSSSDFPKNIIKKSEEDKIGGIDSETPSEDFYSTLMSTFRKNYNSPTKASTSLNNGPFTNSKINNYLYKESKMRNYNKETNIFGINGPHNRHKRKRRKILRDFTSFDPVFEKYFYRKNKDNEIDDYFSDFTYSYYSDYSDNENDEQKRYLNDKDNGLLSESSEEDNNEGNKKVVKNGKECDDDLIDDEYYYSDEENEEKKVLLQIEKRKKKFNRKAEILHPNPPSPTFRGNSYFVRTKKK